MNNFSALKYFRANSTTDQWGDPSKISIQLLTKLDAFREFIGVPIIITSGYRAGDKGEHGRGLAADIMAPHYPGSLFDLYLTAERFGFAGIGIYPDWAYQGAIHGGLHLDVRNAKSARWIGTRPHPGAPNSYVALTAANIQKYPGIL
jgi:hypothetical protein